MIKMLRIDDRLLHGQVVFMWTKQLNIKGIIVANDELVNDPIQSLAMKLAVPEHLKLLIKTIDEAAKLINDPRATGMNILVVMKNPIDAARCAKIEDKAVEVKSATAAGLTKGIG
ncbi:MAG: PTS sugar transporter subunit IIB [Holdemania massiliensis]